MERVWAPWRMEYITSGEKPDSCIFCVANDEGADRERLILYRSTYSYAMLNRYPYTNGHLMAIPYRHTADPAELDQVELLDLMTTVTLCKKALDEVYSPQGFNIGMNLGKAAGAGVDDHIHFHIVPRWNGDTNFMSVLAEARVLPEALGVTMERLKPLFAGQGSCSSS